MIDSTELILESLLETQLKLKILHSSKTIYSKDMKSLAEIKKNTVKLFLKILYSVNLKKVLSSKITNRIIFKYFKKFIFATSFHNTPDLRHNKTTLDKCYLNTVAINSLYEFYNKEAT
jgi:hypothetical protein